MKLKAGIIPEGERVAIWGVSKGQQWIATVSINGSFRHPSNIIYVDQDSFEQEEVIKQISHAPTKEEMDKYWDGIGIKAWAERVNRRWVAARSKFGEKVKWDDEGFQEFFYSID